MLIKFDGYQIEGFVIGKYCTEKELGRKYMSIREAGLFEGNLISLFCRTYRYEEILYDESQFIDFVIDTDTDRIYKPRY